MYGEKYDYAGISTVEEFQDRVPIVTYDDLEPWIERIKKGEDRVLTSEPVRFFETTSGSTGGVKFIPYTHSVLKEFRRAISAWIFDLLMTHPKLLTGTQYWSISPVGMRREPTQCGIPVGIDNDAVYLGLLGKIALLGVMAVPLKVASVSDVDEWRRITLQHLTSSHDLRFISVWNPSFLTLLIEALPDGFDVNQCWPDLHLISCWISGSAERSLPALKAVFPDVEIQGKGLLATEGVVSIPFNGHPAPTVAINSHFIEFLDEKGNAYMVDELAVGKRYRVVITTGSGFARYDLGDEIEVVAPMSVEFVGRSSVSDMCGEKLSEAFVSNALDRAGLNDGFSMLAPEWGDLPRYLLLTDSDEYKVYEEAVESGLLNSFHYDYCRKLGQLGPVEAVYVPDAPVKYMRACISLGQRAGDIKPTALRVDLGWRERMTGYVAS